MEGVVVCFVLVFFNQFLYFYRKAIKYLDRRFLHCMSEYGKEE